MIRNSDEPKESCPQGRGLTEWVVVESNDFLGCFKSPRNDHTRSLPVIITFSRIEPSFTFYHLSLL